MRVLVTGAAGFIGSNLSERLIARGDQVVGFDNFDALLYGPTTRSTKERNLEALRESDRFTFIEGDLLASGDVDRVFAAGPPFDVVVHLAALAGVRPSIEHPARYAAVNVTGTVALAEAARVAGVSRFVFASSSSVYGRDSRPPFRESDACVEPLSPYAASKRAAELALLALHGVHGVSFTNLRFFTVYGPRQRPDLAIHKFTRLIAEGRPIELYGDGSTSRDYTWIDDILSGVLAAIDQQAQGSQPSYRSYNLGGAHTTTLARLVELIGAALGKSPVIERRPEQPGDMKHTWADVTHAGQALGYAPRVTIEEGIPRFVQWWRASNAR